MLQNKFLSFEKVTIVILFVTLSGTFYRYLKVQQHKGRPDGLSEQLLDALFYADKLEGRAFPHGSFKNVSIKSDTFSNFKQPTVALLFSLSDCNPCLETEIQFLKTLWHKRQNDASFDLIGIVVDPDPPLTMVRKYKKITQLNFPLFWDSDKVIINWMPQPSSPLVLFIGENRKIIRAHSPVVNDRLLVEKNYQALERFLVK